MECEYCKKEIPEPKIDTDCVLVSVCCKECRDKILNNMKNYANNYTYKSVFNDADIDHRFYKDK